MNKGSTIDLHNIQDHIYLGYLNEEPFQPSPQAIDASYFGGNPTWLHQPKPELLMCKQCRTALAFLGQIYCPFKADHTYHRILYLLYCDKCLQEFRCLRQQADKDWKPTEEKIETVVKKCCQESFEIDNDSLERKELIKMMKQARHELELQRAIEEESDDDDEDVDEEMMKELEAARSRMGQEERMKQSSIDEALLQAPEQAEEKYDIEFEQYKRVSKELDGPCMLYTDTPLPYNSQPLNHKHFCVCGSKLKLEVQVTEKILVMDSKNPNSRLFLMDWGSLMVYTCSASCSESAEEQIILQRQEESIKDEDIKKLKKSKKNKKKSEKKSVSKGKKEGSVEKGKNAGKEAEREEAGSKMEEEGDWD